MPTLPPLWMEIRAHATHTRLLVRDAGLTLLTARVPPAPAHPRALPSLSEGLALWWNRSLHVVLDVADQEAQWSGAPRWEATVEALRRPLVTIQVVVRPAQSSIDDSLGRRPRRFGTPEQP